MATKRNAKTSTRRDKVFIRELPLEKVNVARFWSNVDCTGDGCWPWKKSRNIGGYGQFAVPAVKQVHGAHRIAYALTYGAIGRGKRILHHCDNPPCCRPDHLFQGSQRDNVRDMHAKGRRTYEGTLRGEEHVNATLTESQVRDIHAARAAGEPLDVLADRYDVQFSTISKIARGVLWKHLGLATLPVVHGNGQQKLSPDDVRAIRKAVAAGEPRAEVARRYGVDPRTIGMIHTRKTWKHVR